MWRGREAVLAILGLSALFVACGYDWTVVPKSDAGTKVACASDDDCLAPELCRFPDRLCGKSGKGTCTPPPPVTSCENPAVELVCTCDGQLLKSRCAAASKNVDLAAKAECPNDLPDTFRCGFVICPLLKTYCVEQRNGDAVDFECVVWDCAEHDCKCPEAKKCACEGDAKAGVTLRCGS